MLCHVPIILVVVSVVHCTKLHERMTDDEIVKIFRTTRANVPEYDVVPIMHNLYKRSKTNLKMQFNAFGESINSYLNPTDGQLAGVDTPVWRASTDKDGILSYTKMQIGIVGIVAGFYHNLFNHVSMLVLQDDSGFPSFEGNIHNLTVTSLPARFQQIARSMREIQPSNPNRTLIETHYHVIIKSNSFTGHAEVSESVKRKTSEISNFSNATDDLRAKRYLPDVVFPTIMITTDYKGAKMSENDLDYYDEIIYQLAFWNAVDLRFRQVEDPKIRLRIAGIVIGQGRTATPYINNAMLNEGFDARKALSLMRWSWPRQNEHLKHAYHLVVTMTDRTMIGVTTRGKIFGLAGSSILAGLCQSPFKSYTLLYDNGGFDGVLAATHELGHLMGLDDDKSTGDDCDRSHGFIMDITDKYTEKNLKWSPCSLRRLTALFRKGAIDCVDEPSGFYPPGQSVDRFLPGMILNDHKQCQARGYDWACEPSPEMCKIMRCYHSGWKALEYGWWCKNSIAAAEGTICSPDHKCIDGECKCITKKCIFNDKT